MKTFPAIKRDVLELIDSNTDGETTDISSLAKSLGADCEPHITVRKEDLIKKLTESARNSAIITKNDLLSICVDYGCRYSYKANTLPNISVMPNNLVSSMTHESSVMPFNVYERHYTSECLLLLSKMFNRNVLLVGKRGVGRESIVKSLCNRSSEGNVPPNITGSPVFRVNIEEARTGAQDRSEVTNKVKMVFRMISESSGIVYIRNMDGLANMINAEILIEVLNNTENVPLIATCTPEGLRNMVSIDNRVLKLNTISVEEPSSDELKHILGHVIRQYEVYHRCRVENSVLSTIINLSEKYVHSIPNPAASIEIIDRTLATRSSSAVTQRPWREAVSAGDFELASSMKGVFEVDPDKGSVTKDDVISCISSMTGQKVLLDDGSRVDYLKSTLLDKVVNQEQAITKICNTIKTSLMFNDGKRPIGSFILIGSSSVGKTYMAEIIADTMFDGKIIRLDMSEYMERHTVSKLVGSPPGYVGYHEGGLLTNFVRENPYCVILLDEFEKAHDDVHNVMLSVLDAGKLDDMTSGTVRFCNTLVIMTGNVGTETLLSKRDYNVGFNSEKIDKNSAVMNEMKKRITPALMDRVNEVIIFNKLSKQDLHIIIDMEISKLKSPGSPDVSVTDTAKEALLSDWETGEGARSVRRKVIANILPVVVEYDCSTKEDKVFLVDHDGSRFFVREVRDRSLT